MSYEEQKNYFETAYNTGSDTWTNSTIPESSKQFIEELPAKAMVLDIGSGRGRFPFTLAENGFRVIGLEYVTSLVKKNNEEVLNKALDGSIRFVEGDVLDIPFSDDGFDGVVDIGLLQHLKQSDFEQYKNEVVRVLKSGGCFLLSVLSKDTPVYFTWHPKNDEMSSYEKEGLQYYFFTDEEITKLFENNFEIVSHTKETVSSPQNPIVHAMILKKK